VGLLVSVPCIDCDGPVYFGDEQCRRCATPVSREVRDVLDERLDATGGEFTVMRNRIRELSWLFFFLAGLRAFQTMLVLLAGWSPLVLVDLVLVGGGMVLGGVLAPRHPRKAVALVAVVWGGWEILAAVVNPLSFATGILFKLITLAAMIRGYRAATTADRIRRELAREADASVKLEFRPP
jgi:hypothetical protein